MPQQLIIHTSEHSFRITTEQFRLMPPETRIADVHQLDERRNGTGIRLAALFETLDIEINRITALVFKSSADNFEKPISAASLPTLWEQACVLYELNGAALTAEQGGPFRLFVPATVMCGTAELDNCANIKYLDEIVVV